MTFSLQRLSVAVDEATEDSKIVKEISEQAAKLFASKPDSESVLVVVGGKKYRVARTQNA